MFAKKPRSRGATMVLALFFRGWMFFDTLEQSSIKSKTLNVQQSSPGQTEGLKVGCEGWGVLRNGWIGGRMDGWVCKS